jgi:rhodanese-related sulfurtransferase
MAANAAALARLAPLAALSADRLTELAGLAAVRRVARGADALGAADPTHASFLLEGELLLVYEGGGTLVIVGGSDDASQPLRRRKPAVARTKAITDVDVVSFDDEMLDIAATWDQVAKASEATLFGGAFSLGSLRSGALAQLPAAHIDELLRRFEKVKVKRGDTVIREGDDGDYYYVIEAGRFQVERLVGGAKIVLAELKAGEAFGEEALVSDARRNASVTALGDGQLLRLRRADFNQSLRQPLLRRLPFAEASSLVRAGAVWLDVRYPSEYQYDGLPGALNVPLAEVRDSFSVLDRSRDYIAYCRTGRRSAAAAFLFSQRGFKVSLLDGGLKAVAAGR